MQGNSKEIHSNTSCKLEAKGVFHYETGFGLLISYGECLFGLVGFNILLPVVFKTFTCFI